MSGTGGTAPPTAVLGLDVGGPWRRGAVHRSRALAPPEPHGVAAQPALSVEGSGTRTPLRLPSLVGTAKGPRRRSGMARLSLSEPSLLLPSDSVLMEGRSGPRRSSVLHKPPRASSLSRPSTVLPCRTCHLFGTHEQQQNQQNQTCSRPAHTHFSQPGPRPQAMRRHSHNPATSSEMMRVHARSPAAQRRDLSFHEEPLSVVGKSCLLRCSQRPLAAGRTRTQLHVFLPTEAEGEEADRESVDEGFMDELDTRISSMKLRRVAPRTVANPS